MKKSFEFPDKSRKYARKYAKSECHLLNEVMEKFLSSVSFNIFLRKFEKFSVNIIHVFYGIEQYLWDNTQCIEQRFRKFA